MTIPSEILAAIIGAVITAIVGGIAWYIKTHIGNKVIIEKISESSLIGFSDKISEDLSITYKGNPVKQLFFYKFRIYNDSYINIANFSTEIQFTSKAEFPIFLVQTELLPQSCSIDYNLLEDGLLIVNLEKPYLNTIKQDKNDIINLQFISDEKFSYKAVGGGVGWFLEIREKPPIKKKFFYTGLSILGVITLLALWVLLVSPTIIDSSRQMAFICLGIISFVLASVRWQR